MIWEILKNFGTSTGIAQLFQGDGWKQLIMILIAILLLYLAIFKEAEPMELVRTDTVLPLMVNMTSLLDKTPKTFDNVTDNFPSSFLTTDTSSTSKTGAYL